MSNQLDVKAFRAKTGLSQKEFAKKLHANVSTISRAENGKASKNLTWAIKSHFAEYFPKEDPER